MLTPSLYNISTHTFTSCGCTGANGPTFSNNYYGVTWSNYITSSGTKQGVQLWTAPLSTIYNFEVAGCAGVQYPGASTGAIMRGDIFLQKGQQIQILVGQYGGANFGTSGSGGTFVADMSNNPLIVAGGGAGNVNSTSNASASITTTARSSPDAIGGSNGYGGISVSGNTTSNIAWGGGGGFYGDATLTPFGGYGFINGGKGGFGSNGWSGATCDGRAQAGGFGGGGGTSSTCSPPGGGGGGYTGGAGGFNWYGGGGGSYSIALNQSNTELAQGNSGAGYVKITFGKPVDSNRPVSMNELRQIIGSNAGPISMSQVYGRFLGVSSSGNIGISDIIGKPVNVGVTPTKTSNTFVTTPHPAWIAPSSFTTPSASWIWYTSNASTSAPTDIVPKVFEKVIYQSNNSSINAHIYYAVDNMLQISLNRTYIGGSTAGYNYVTSNAITLLPGSNLFEFYLTNLYVSPAGFIYSVLDTNNNVLAISDSNTLFSTTMSTDNMLYLNFDAANTGINTPDTTMTNWRNTSWMGTSYNATASNGPVLRYNKRWYVEFNRTKSSYFNINTSISHLLSTWGGMTVFVVGQMTNIGSFERFFDFGNGPANNNIAAARYWLENTNYMEIWNESASIPGHSLAYAMDSNWYIWTYAAQVTSSNTVMTVYRNGSNVVSSNFATVATDRTTTINYLGRSQWSSDEYLTGNISEYRFYQGFLNSTIVKELYNTLRVKWNL